MEWDDVGLLRAMGDGRGELEGIGAGGGQSPRVNITLCSNYLQAD